LVEKQQWLTRLIDLSVELQALWNTRTEVVPGALGGIPERTNNNSKLTKMNAHLMQKSVILRTGCYNFEETF